MWIPLPSVSDMAYGCAFMVVLMSVIFAAVAVIAYLWRGGK